MNAVIMDEAELGEECIIGALTFVKAGEKIPRRSLVAGNPGKIIREVSDEMIRWKSEGTALYQKLPSQCFESLREVEPHRTLPEGYLDQISAPDYQPWKSK
jgi:phenylacetic acid degradation protein